jgi:hypothetical protein
MVTHHADVGAFAGPHEVELDADDPGVTRAAAE